MPAFAGNQVFRLRRDDHVAFLKLADGPDLRREVAVLRLLWPLRVPVPRIEAADPAGDLAGVACVLLREVGGEPADCASPGFLQAGLALRQVHGVVADGYGPLTVSQNGLRGEDRTWAGALERRTNELGAIADSGLVDAGLLDQAAAAINDRRDLLEAVEGSHLLHGDVTPRHVYSCDGRLTGIIDWGDAICGDPVYDLGRVLHSAILERGDVGYGFAVVNRFLDTYGDAPWLHKDLTEPLLLYATVFIVWSMQGELAGGAPWPPWWPAQAVALAAILDALAAG